jgi:hypothetical protein
MPQNDEAQEAQAVFATAGREAEMRNELASTVTGFFEHLVELPEEAPSTSPGEQARLIALATLAVRCRSAVERDSYNRQITNVPQPERPARMMRCLVQLLAALKVLGVPADAAWSVVCRVALDSMPAVRRKAFEAVAQSASGVDTATANKSTGTTETSMRRGLEELEAHGVVRRKGTTGQLWYLSSWALARVKEIGDLFPECQETLT